MPGAGLAGPAPARAGKRLVADVARCGDGVGGSASVFAPRRGVSRQNGGLWREPGIAS